MTVKFFKIGIIVAGGILATGFYNNLVTAQEKVDNQWIQVHIQYQRRLDLLPDLSLELTSAKNNYAQTRTPSDQVIAANQLESTLGKLLTHHDIDTELVSQLSNVDTRINVERQRYNETVRDYNTTIKRFPEYVLADLFGFSERPYFQANQ